MAVTRAFANVLSDDLPATRDFYVALLDLEVAFDSDWFVNLNSGQPEPGAGSPGCELGIWRRDHELIPADFQRPPSGTVLTFVVDDVDAVYARAQRHGLPVVAEPRNLFYGQRQLLVTDPNNALVDVSTPVEPSAEFAASLVQDGSTIRQLGG